LATGPTVPTFESQQAADMHLRFQLPASVLPLKVEGARLLAKIHAPSRRITLSAPVEEGAVELYRVENPVDPIRTEITDVRCLRLDADGGLHLNVSVSDYPKAGKKGPEAWPHDEKWTIEYLELEVSGKTATRGK